MKISKELARLHHNGHAELISRIEAQYRKKGNRKLVRPVVALKSGREVLMFRKLQKYYKDFSKRLSDGFDTFGENGAISALTNSNEILGDIIFNENSKTAGVLGNWQMVNFRKSHRQVVATKQFEDEIEEILRSFLLENALNSVELILETDRQNVAKIISAGIADGIGEREISRQLRQSFGGNLGKNSAARIARTEVGIAGSKGQDTGAREIGAEQKLWVAVDDDRTRGHHNDIDGARVPLDEFFTPLGEQMAHPHDTQHGASPRNFINCRCAVLYD